MIKNCPIIINAYSPAVTRQATRLAEELGLIGVTANIRRNDGFILEVKDGLAGALDFDCCVYLDKDKYIAKMLEARGVRLFNRAEAIAVCDDKMLTHIALCDRGIPMPRTLAGLLCYDDDAPIPERVIDEVEARLGYPLVVKQSYGSLGKGVFKADDREQLTGIMRRIKTAPHLFQQYVAAAHGKDMRVIVVGDEVVGGIIRSSKCDFRSNIGLGGSAEKTNVPAEIAELALKTAKLLDLDYCGLDFLLSPSPLLCEVNSNAFFDAFEETTGINVARIYSEHIAKEIKL